MTSNPTKMTVKPLPYDQASDKQKSYLRDLITQHPDYSKTYGSLPRTSDTIDVYYIAWLNEKYAAKYLDHQLESMDELDKETASALISHLKNR
jgi:hypothetical protein